MHSSLFFSRDMVSVLRLPIAGAIAYGLDMLSHEGRGGARYLPQKERGIGLAQKIRAYALQAQRSRYASRPTRRSFQSRTCAITESALQVP